jgi:hypothetical protein
MRGLQTKGGGSSEVAVRGWLGSTLFGGDPVKCSTLLLHIFNWPPFSGSAVELEGVQGPVFRQLVFNWDGGRLVLDPTCVRDEDFAGESGGGSYRLTNVARLELRAGAIRTQSDIDEWVRSVYNTLSFIAGRDVGVSLVYGLSDDGEVQCRWIGTPVVTRRQVGGGSWVARYDSEQVCNAGSAMLARMQDESWREPLIHSTQWYVRANQLEGKAELQIVLVQAALELLSWSLLVENHPVVSESGFRDLPAGDKLRLALAQAGIGTEVPKRYARLASVATRIGATSGPDVFVFIRNKLMHPSLKQRKKLKSVDGVARVQAAKYGLGCLELLLLSAMGFTGSIRPRWDGGGG